ncbi:MAG: KpsF/GutQ family sugar-phosphate isomerase, partial [Geminicoccales bacterium]
MSWDPRMIAVTSPIVVEPDRVEPPERARSATLAAGRRVLRAEADALIDLADALDDRFDRAVDRIAATRGRVVVTGMG